VTQSDRNKPRRNKGADALACKTVSVLKKRCNYNWADLAKLTGSGPKVLKDQVSLRFPSRRIRARLESAFGVPIWSSEAAWQQRLREKEILGLDPALATRKQLRDLARSSGLRGWGHLPNRRKFIDLLAAHLAVNKQFRSPHTSTPTPPRHD
jgi:hypothetical protein